MIHIVNIENNYKFLADHYDTFDLIKADPKKFKKRAEYAEVAILNPGDSVIL